MVTKMGQEVLRWLLDTLILTWEGNLWVLGHKVSRLQFEHLFLQMTLEFLEKLNTQPTTNSPTLCLAGQRDHDSPCGLCE